MNTAINQDFWPMIEINPQIVTPISILRAQAARIGEKTKNLVEGEVHSRAEGQRLLHMLYLKAPALDNYRYHLLTVVQLQYKLYPVGILDEYEPSLQKYIAQEECENEEAFVERLRGILSSDRTKYVIESLIAQSIN